MTYLKGQSNSGESGFCLRVSEPDRTGGGMDEEERSNCKDFEEIQQVGQSGLYGSDPCRC